jgi:hypothetical protein
MIMHDPLILIWQMNCDGHGSQCIVIINFCILLVAVARIIPSGALMLGQNGYTLTCRVFVTNNFCNPSITYQWIMNNDTSAVQIGAEPDILFFYSLRLSDAGLYTCYATINSPTLSGDISATASHEVKIQSELKFKSYTIHYFMTVLY